LADVRERERDAAAALRKLQRGVDTARDRLHVVFDAQQEARDELAALRLAKVQERRSRRLKATRDDLAHVAARKLLIALCQAERHHDHAILETLKVAITVKRLQRVGGEELERTEEGRETE